MQYNKTNAQECFGRTVLKGKIQPCKWNSSGKKPACHVAFHFLTTHTAMHQHQKIRKGKGIERKGTKTGEIANGNVGTKQNLM